MSQPDIDILMDLWAASLLAYGGSPPFVNHGDMHRTIDATMLGDAPWESFIAGYTGPQPTANVPTWMTAKYQIWTRNPRTVLNLMLANPDFEDEVDFCPYREFTPDGERCFVNVMSGDWAWRQAVRG